jgi:hypothetical protein
MIATMCILATGVFLDQGISTIPTGGAEPVNAFSCRYTMTTRAVVLMRVPGLWHGTVQRERRQPDPGSSQNF